MNSARSVLPALLLAGTLGWSAAPVGAQEGVLLKVAAIPASSYCHLKFPAIREETLSWDRPLLKDASTTDIIDFYGPCDTDPLGRDQVTRQRRQVQQGDD